MERSGAEQRGLGLGLAELHRVPVLFLLARAQPRPDRPGVLEAEQAAGPAPPETARPGPMT